MALENKIFNDGENYLTLVELAKSQKYSLEYLFQAAISGKLKAFKFGDDWLTTARWFDDYHSLVKKEINSEITKSQIEANHNKWVEFFTGGGFKVALAREMFLIIFIFAIFSFFLSALAFSYTGHQFAFWTKPAIDKTSEAADNFLKTTNYFYTYSFNYLVYLAKQIKGIVLLLSEASTQAAKGSVYLVLSGESVLGKYQIADELLTQKLHELIANLKNQYQAVAGTSAIRQQIYFDDWQESLKTAK